MTTRPPADSMVLENTTLVIRCCSWANSANAGVISGASAGSWPVATPSHKGTNTSCMTRLRAKVSAIRKNWLT